MGRDPPVREGRCRVGRPLPARACASIDGSQVSAPCGASPVRGHGLGPRPYLLTRRPVGEADIRYRLATMDRGGDAMNKAPMLTPLLLVHIAVLAACGPDSPETVLAPSARILASSSAQWSPWSEPLNLGA